MKQAAPWQPVLEAALAVRRHAYAPYSHFAVGAAVQGESGAVFSGCNVENASYGLTVCAERSALFQAVAAGERRFRWLVVVADTPKPVPPCGACRQVMAEFSIGSVVLANLAGDVAVYTQEELLPFAFRGDKKNDE